MEDDLCGASWRPMNRRKLATLLFFLIPLLLLIPVAPVHAATTGTLSSGWYWLQLTDGRMAFTNTVSFSGSNWWAYANGITFYGASMGSGTAPASWYIDIAGNGNLTITRLFDAFGFEATVAGTSTTTTITTIDCSTTGMPSKVTVTGATSSSYAEVGSALEVTITHSSATADILLTWTVPVPPQATPIPQYVNPLMQYVWKADFIGLILGVYTTTMGSMFFGIILLIVTLPIYIRTQSVMYCAVVWILCSGLLIAFTPIAWQSTIALFLVLALGGLLYSIFSRR